MTDVIEARPVDAATTTDVYVLMVRSKMFSWFSWSTDPLLSTAESRAKKLPTRIEAWKIVHVSGLPIDVPAGEAKS